MVLLVDEYTDVTQNIVLEVDEYTEVAQDVVQVV